MDCDSSENRVGRGLLRAGALLALCVVALLRNAHARSDSRPLVLVDSVYVRNDSILVDVTTERIFDAESIRALTRGATSAITFELQLWRPRRFFPDGLVSKTSIRAKIFFEPLEIAYAVSFPDTAPPVYVDLEDLDGFFHKLKGLAFDKRASELSRGNYYVVVSVVVEPLAVESYREIQRWLRGQADLIAKDLRKQSRRGDDASGGKNRFLKLLLDLTGFGDRAYVGHSRTITLP